MNRSHHYVFVPFCLLAQGVRAQNIVRKYQSTVRPVLNTLFNYNINIIQMTCPELLFDGFVRKPCQKPKYDTQENRKICSAISVDIVKFIQQIRYHNNDVDLILGIDFSPSCAVKYLTGRPPKRKIRGSGIYIEELKKIMASKRIIIPIVGIEIYNIEKSLREIEGVLKGRKK